MVCLKSNSELSLESVEKWWIDSGGIWTWHLSILSPLWYPLRHGVCWCWCMAQYCSDYEEIFSTRTCMQKVPGSNPTAAKHSSVRDDEWMMNAPFHFVIFIGQINTKQTFKSTDIMNLWLAEKKRKIFINMSQEKESIIKFLTRRDGNISDVFYVVSCHILNK